jgi:hypothetical protein
LGEGGFSTNAKLFTLGSSLKFTKWAIQWISLSINCDKKWATIFFSQSHLATLASSPVLPDFSSNKIPKWGKIYQMTKKIPNGHKYFKWP